MIVSLVIKVDIHINAPVLSLKVTTISTPTLPVDCLALRSCRLRGTAIS